MHAQTPNSDEVDAVRSVSLDELLTDRMPSRRARPGTRIVVPAVSLLVLIAAAGIAFHYIGSGPEEGAILSIEGPSPIHTGSVPAGTATGVSDRAEPAPLSKPDTIVAARLPKPRPPAPATVVAASHPRHDRRYAYQQEPDPCSALQAMRAYLPFKVYCVSDRPPAAPVHPRYRPHPAYGRW